MLQSDYNISLSPTSNLTQYDDKIKTYAVDQVLLTGTRGKRSKGDNSSVIIPMKKGMGEKNKGLKFMFLNWRLDLK